ncbi:MAG: hypothetical protein H7Z11_17260, partial [Verrucomicrobia bacterium]|nr:hypothetical protein [Leptolyngbya sp. ES-bin-22]
MRFDGAIAGAGLPVCSYPVVYSFEAMEEDYNRCSAIQVLQEKSVSEDAIKIFYSYSRKDLDMRNTLED